MDLDTRSFMDDLFCGVNSSLCRSVLFKALNSNQQDPDANCAWVRKTMIEFGWADMASVTWSPLQSADRDGRKKFSLQLPDYLDSVGDLAFLVSMTMPWPVPSTLDRKAFVSDLRRLSMEGLAAYKAAYEPRLPKDGRGSPNLANDDEIGKGSPNLANEDEIGKGSPNLANEDEIGAEDESKEEDEEEEEEDGTEAIADDVEVEDEFLEEEEDDEGFVVEVHGFEDIYSDEDDENYEDDEEMPPRPSTPTPSNSCPRNSSPPLWKCSNFVSNPRPSKMQCVSKK